MTVFPSNDIEIQEMIKDADGFESFFNTKSVGAKFGAGCWENNGRRGWKLSLSDGSYITLRFFDTIKEIFNSKNITVPGRESYLSYVEVNVMPSARKGYGFKSWAGQHVMEPKPGRAKAIVLHQESIKKLIDKAEALGIDLNGERDVCWETYFQRFK